MHQEDALSFHLGPGVAHAWPARLRPAGAVSLTFWTSALIAGHRPAFID